MKISENCLIIRYDQQDEKIVVRRPLENDISEERAVLHTEYPLSKIKTMAITTACRLLGEDILLSLSGTRKLFSDVPQTKKVKSQRKKRKG